jgi:Endonuclease NucS C-terminal domain
MMPRSWQEDFLERLVTFAHQTGDPRLPSARLHPRKKTVSFTDPGVRWVECIFDTDRINRNPNRQVFAVKRAAKRGTDIDAPLLKQEHKKARLGGEMNVDQGVVLLQYQWGYGRDETFPLHDPRRVAEVTNWAHAALRLLFTHVQNQRNVVTVRAPAPAETGAVSDLVLALEKYLEDRLVECWDSLAWTAPLPYLGRQVPCAALGFIDILARDRATRDFVVIELKRDLTDDEAVGQLSRYMGWIKKHRAAPVGVGVRGIIVVRAITPKLRAAALAHETVELYTYDFAIVLHPVELPERRPDPAPTC